MSENFECAELIWQFKKEAWKLGYRSATNSDSMRINLQNLNEAVADFSSSKPIPGLKRAAYNAYRKGLLAYRVPKDAVERAVGAIFWYMKNVSAKFRKNEKYFWVTNSKNFILLSYLAFALGHGCRPFTFAEHRIHDVLKGHEIKISTGTICEFLKWARKRRYIEIVREGDNRPGCWTASRYRLTNVDELIAAFEMDAPSSTCEGRGLSFVEYVKSNLKFTA